MSRLGTFRQILVAYFVSQAGSHFLTLALSAYILFHTGSVIQAATVYVAAFLPSFLVASQLGAWVDKAISRSLLVQNELVGALFSLLSGLLVYVDAPLGIICAALAIRSVVSFTGRTGATKWIKVVSTPAQQAERFKVFSLIYFLSTALSGLVASLALAKLSILLVVAIDVSSYFLAAIVLTLLPEQVPTSNDRHDEAHAITSPRLVETLKSIMSMESVRISFLWVVCSQTVFQGAYGVLVSYLPLRHFQVGLAGVGWYQIATSLGIILGFTLLKWSPNLIKTGGQLGATKAPLISVTALLSLVSSTISGSLPLSISLFFLMNLCFECIWLHHSSEFFRSSPKHAVARYQFVLSAAAAFVMSAATLCYSVAIQYLGLGLGVVTVVAGILLSGGILMTMSEYLRNPPELRRVK